MQPFWRRSRWVAGHLLAATAVGGFVALGLWQLDRLDERLARNALVTERAAADEVTVEALAGAEPADTAFRPVRVSGTYEPGGEVLLSMRSLGGRAGHHLLTPLRTPAGTLVVVDRGWVPMDFDDSAAPPAGPVEVSGVAMPGETARRAGRLDGSRDGPLEFVSEVDTARIAAALGEPVSPFYVVARAQEPPPDGLPVVAEPPPLDEGNHRSYAGQWFLFAAVVAVGYPLLLRRTARSERADGAQAAPEPSRPPAPTRP